jgi:hypothetical protein
VTGTTHRDGDKPEAILDSESFDGNRGNFNYKKAPMIMNKEGGSRGMLNQHHLQYSAASNKLINDFSPRIRTNAG